MTKLFRYVATLEFEAEDEDEAYDMMTEYLANGDCDSSLYDATSWALDPLSGEDAEDEDESEQLRRDEKHGLYPDKTDISN
jgi:hypothetical protein